MVCMLVGDSMKSSVFLSLFPSSYSEFIKQSECVCVFVCLSMSSRPARPQKKLLSPTRPEPARGDVGGVFEWGFLTNSHKGLLSAGSKSQTISKVSWAHPKLLFQTNFVVTCTSREVMKTKKKKASFWPARFYTRWWFSQDNDAVKPRKELIMNVMHCNLLVLWSQMSNGKYLIFHPKATTLILYNCLICLWAICLQISWVSWMFKE